MASRGGRIASHGSVESVGSRSSKASRRSNRGTTLWWGVAGVGAAGVDVGVVVEEAGAVEVEDGADVPEAPAAAVHRYGLYLSTKNNQIMNSFL